MNEKESIFESFIFAISQIDGGCIDCVCNFIDTINDDIKKFGFEYQYNTLDRKVHLVRIL